jgi:hypothetical protein
MAINQKIEQSKKLIVTIAQIGRERSLYPPKMGITPFEHYFNRNGKVKYNELDKNDGLWTRREILSRYLLVNAVLDQGPDMEGVGLLLRDVTNTLYQNEIRIFHRPLDFFKELGIAIDSILDKHQNIRNIRADEWARVNNSTPNKYSLFFSQSTRGIVSTKQVLDYSVYRWGVPLCLPLLLERDLRKNEQESQEPLVDYIESWDSAEIMSKMLKDNERYGLGSAIGDKACHLFAKWFVHTFKLTRRTDDCFGPLSYELPLDSNAGRVLFRIGFLLNCAEIDDYENWNVIQKEAGKDGKHYIRVTNIRGCKSQLFSESQEFMDSYATICLDHLKTRIRRPTMVEIQQIPNVSLLGTGYGIGDLDDGLMFIGTNYCFNHDEPNCRECPIRHCCAGYNNNRELIENYRT